MTSKYPILEFDSDRNPIIRPEKRDGLQHDNAVLCFFKEVIDNLEKSGKISKIFDLKSEMGNHPIFVLEYLEAKILIFHPGIGAALSGGMFDELIQGFGVRNAIICGGAGVLKKDIQVGKIILPTSAIRDEGTSYHYLPPSREVGPSDKALDCIRKVFSKHHVDWIEGKTWTTDGYYRETKKKINDRKEEGCLSVEMEAAAFFAVGKFHQIDVGQFLYSGDDVSGDKWDFRDWTSRTSIREKIFWLAIESCYELSNINKKTNIY